MSSILSTSITALLISSKIRSKYSDYIVKTSKFNTHHGCWCTGKGASPTERETQCFRPCRRRRELMYEVRTTQRFLFYRPSRVSRASAYDSDSEMSPGDFYGATLFDVILTNWSRGLWGRYECIRSNHRWIYVFNEGFELWLTRLNHRRVFGAG